MQILTTCRGHNVMRDWNSRHGLLHDCNPYRIFRRASARYAAIALRTESINILNWKNIFLSHCEARQERKQCIYRERDPSIPVKSTVRISPVFIFIDTGPYPPHFSLSVYLISSMLKISSSLKPSSPSFVITWLMRI